MSNTSCFVTHSSIAPTYLFTAASSSVKSTPNISVLHFPSYIKLNVTRTLMSTYSVDSEAGLASERSFLEIGQDVFGDDLVTCSVEFNLSIVFGSESPVVLFDTLAWATPAQIHIDD